MAYYPQEWIDEVRLRNDIVEVVSGYVQLKRNGSRFLGLCPFHGEKTPSFSVNQDKQFFYCFGCHEGGNIFQFLMKIENMDFPEAARHLAERANMAIPEGTSRPGGPSREHKGRLLEALTEAARWYHKRLYAPQGEAALAYLHERGIRDNTIRRFGLGATGDGWDHLTAHLIDMGFSVRELEDAYLTMTRETRSFDAFRRRTMIPIFDARGRVIAFGGRMLGEGQPKYLNSSDTPVFSKSRTVYGLNFLKGGVSELFLLEGYMDVISLAQHGVEGGVASLGTAFTPDQARLIKRKVGEEGEVAIAYDGDAAGQRATRRAIDIFAVEGLSVKVITIPGGEDPDDFVRRNGGQAFLQLPRESAIGYLLGVERAARDMGDLDGRTAYAKAAAAILATVQSPLELETYVKQLSVETGFSGEALYEQIGRTPKLRLTARVVENTGPQLRDTTKDRLPDHVKAQRNLLSLIAAGRVGGDIAIAAEDFQDPLCERIARALLANRGDPMAASRLLEEVEQDQRANVSEILAQEVDARPDQVDAIARDCLHTMRRRQLEDQLEELTRRMEGQRPSEAPDLFDRYMRLTEVLTRLKEGRAAQQA